MPAARIARSRVHRPLPATNDDLALMRQLDEPFTAWSFLGSRRMTAMLRAEGRPVNRKRVRQLMRWMGSPRSGRGRGPPNRRPDTRYSPTCGAASRSSGRPRTRKKEEKQPDKKPIEHVV